MTQAIDDRDIHWTETGGSARPDNRAARSKGLTSASIEAVHVPSGICATGVIPRGAYDRKEMAALKERLRARICERLVEEIAAAARVGSRGPQKVVTDPAFEISARRLTEKELRRF